MATQNTLAWNPNTETDLAGYNVYRKIDTGALAKINGSLIPKGTTSYNDPFTVDGTYTYNVTAVDTSNNESAHSLNVSTVVNTVPPVAPTGLTVVQS